MRVDAPPAVLALVLAAVSLVTGCGKRFHSGSAPPKAPAKIPEMSAGAGAGSMTIRVPPTNRLAYTVNWKSAVVTVTDPVHLEGSGSFKGVSGTLYRAGNAAADFSADEGTADKSKGVLTLKGNVMVTAVGGESELKGTKVNCDVVTYATADEIIKASGGVMIRNSSYTLGPLPAAWCSNTLSEVASPAEFVPVRHNQPAKPHL